MNKVLIELFIPSLGKTYDIYIPLNITIIEATRILSTSVYELAPDEFIEDNNILCDFETGKPYELEKFINECNIVNGTKLMLL